MSPLGAIVLAVLSTSVAFSFCFAAGSPASGAVSTDIARIEQVLGRAGSSPAEIPWVDENELPNASAKEVALGHLLTVAWQSPDQFRKVIVFSGRLTKLRGGNMHP
jgi:hypothetical protein